MNTYPGLEGQVIIFVDQTPWAGPVVRWYLTDKPENCSPEVQPDLSASREGVLVGTYLHRVEGALLDHAKGLHTVLAKERDEDAEWIRLAIPTHVRVPGGLPVAVGPAVDEHQARLAAQNDTEVS